MTDDSTIWNPRTDRDLPETRTKRARQEAMDIALGSVGVYVAYSTSGNRYRVDVLEKRCSCPDWEEQPPSGGCKHLRRVNIEIHAGTVPRPDGRLPTVAATDGGETPLVEPTDTDTAARISGPHYERDRHGDYTGVTFYRCEECGCEALRRRELQGNQCCR